MADAVRQCVQIQEKPVSHPSGTQTILDITRISTIITNMR